MRQGPLWAEITLLASLLWFLLPESEGRVQLVVPGSCEGPQEAFVGAGSFRFHWPACWEQELSIHLQVVPASAWVPSLCSPPASPGTPGSQARWEVWGDLGLLSPSCCCLLPPRAIAICLRSSSSSLQDAPQEQLKVPLRALPSGQVVRLVFPTSQGLVTGGGKPGAHCGRSP